MSNTKFIFHPLSAEFQNINFPRLYWKANYKWCLLYSGSTNQNATWTTVAPQGLSPSTMRAYIYWTCSVDTGDVDWDIGIESIAEGEDVGYDNSFDTANSADNNNVPGNINYLEITEVDLNNYDGMQPGEVIRFRLTRDAVSDTSTGFAEVYALEIRDNAD